MDKPKNGIQVSQRELKATPERETPLPAEEKVGGFRSSPPTYDDLDSKEIQPFIGVPDYIDPTLSPYPLVVESDGVYHCIDGWDMIQKAIGEGKARITCDVFHVPGCSETELSIRKASVRMMPKGGVARYPEIVRNVWILSDRLISSMENPVIYSHGGARRGEGFTKNREDNIRLLLAERLGKSKTTISAYLTYGEYLTDEVLSELIRGGAGKDFFEKAQVVKRRIIDDLIDSGTPKEEITTQVSEAMLQMHRDPQEIENRKITLFHGAEEAVPAQEDSPTTDRDVATKTPAEFKHWTGAEADSSEATPTEEEFRRQGAEISERMRVRFQDQELTLTALKEGVRQDLGDLASLISMIEEER